MYWQFFTKINVEQRQKIVFFRTENSANSAAKSSWFAIYSKRCFFIDYECQNIEQCMIAILWEPVTTNLPYRTDSNSKYKATVPYSVSICGEQKYKL